MICKRGMKGSSWWLKLFPKSSETKIREPWPPDTSAERITCRPGKSSESENRRGGPENKTPARPWHNPANATYFPGVLRADGNAKLWSDEGVVNETGHVLKRLSVVLTGRQNPTRIACNYIATNTQPFEKKKKKRRALLDLPAVQFGLPESHQEEGHLECSQSQDDLQAEKTHVKESSRWAKIPPGL